MSWVSSIVWLINDENNLTDATKNPHLVNNANEFKNIMTGYGWSLNAICGLLGNATYESSINPGMYERGSGRPYYQSGYGLIQWTNTKATSEAENPLVAWINTNYGDNNWQDGDRQCVFINGDDGANWIEKSPYLMSYDEFKHSTDDVQYLTRAYHENRERGTWAAKRAKWAKDWYDYFQGSPSQGYPIVITAHGNCNPFATLHLNEGIDKQIFYAEAGTDIFIHANVGAGDYFQLWVADYPASLVIDMTTGENTFFTMPDSKVNITCQCTGETPTPPPPPPPPPVPKMLAKHRMPIWIYPCLRG